MTTTHNAGRREWIGLAVIATSAAMLIAARALLGLAGGTILGSIATAVYRGAIPAGAPDAARDTLGGAVAASERASDPALLDTAREAFTQGLQVAASTGAAVLVAAAIVAAAMLRRVDGEPTVALRPATGET